LSKFFFECVLIFLFQRSRGTKNQITSTPGKFNTANQLTPKEYAPTDRGAGADITIRPNDERNPQGG